jgi:hypothetical protein
VILDSYVLFTKPNEEEQHAVHGETKEQQRLNNAQVGRGESLMQDARDHHEGGVAARHRTKEYTPKKFVTLSRG